MLICIFFFSASTCKEFFDKNVQVNYSLRTKPARNLMREYENKRTTYNDSSENDIALSIATLISTCTLASIQKTSASSKSTLCHFLNIWKP